MNKKIIILIFIISTFGLLASCNKKQKTEEKKEINHNILEGCYLTIQPDIRIYSDSTLDAYNSIYYTGYTPGKGEILDVKESAIQLKYSFEFNEHTGWFSTNDIEITYEIYLKCQEYLLNGEYDSFNLNTALSVIAGANGFYTHYEQEYYDNIIENVKYIIDKVGIKKFQSLKTGGNEYSNKDYFILQTLYSLVFNSCQTVYEVPNFSTNILHILAANCNESTLEFLCRHPNYVIESFIDLYDEQGRNCLMIAIDSDNYDAVKFFSNLEFDICHVDLNGKNLSDHINESKNKDIQKLLAKYNNLILDEYIQYLTNNQITQEYPILLTQFSFDENKYVTVIKDTEIITLDGKNSKVNAGSEVYIMYAFDDSLAEYDDKDDPLYNYNKYHTKYNYYLVRDKNQNIGIMSGNNFAHGIISLDESNDLLFSYKYIENQYLQDSDIDMQISYDSGCSVFADIYKFSKNTYTSSKLSTGISHGIEFVSKPMLVFSTPSLHSSFINTYNIKLYVLSENFYLNVMDYESDKSSQESCIACLLSSSYNTSQDEIKDVYYNCLLLRENNFDYISFCRNFNDYVYMSDTSISSEYHNLEFIKTENSDYPDLVFTHVYAWNQYDDETKEVLTYSLDDETFTYELVNNGFYPSDDDMPDEY